MAEFVIGSTNFGVDADRSSFKLLTKPHGRVLLDIELNGDQSAYDAACAVEGWEWSWTMYPPRFYLFAEVDRALLGHNLTVELSAAEIESAEMAIYMMNHNHVADVIVMIDDNRLRVSGRVDMMGQPTAFRIDWLRSPNAEPGAAPDTAG